MQANLRKLIPLLAVVTLLGCDVEQIIASSAKFTEDFSHTYELTADGRISVESFNGSIEVIGWNKDEVEITGTKYANSQELLDAVKVNIVDTDSSIHVRAVRPSARRGNMGVRFVIHAPKVVDLDRLTSSNGSITVTGIDGDARVETSNGRIRFTDLDGNIEATTSNGAVKLEDTSGSAVIKTSNGSVSAEHVSGHFSAKTSNGSITASVSGEDEGGRPIELRSSNGSIKLYLEDQPSAEVSVTTSNASITVYAPPSLQANVKADTSNSKIKTDFDVTVRGVQKKSRLEGTINGGGPQLTMDSSNGGIRLLKNEPEV
jgi:type VI protein secretion system component Hcp